MLNRFPLFATAGLLLSLGFSSLGQGQAQAQTSAKLNPCPGMYYEAPFNERFSSPEGCPPNAARKAQQVRSVETQTSRSAPQLPQINPSESFPSVPAESTVQPLPEELDQAIARIIPQNNQLTVTLINETNAMITYEVIGETDRRTLSGGNTIVLRGLSLPSTISAVRNDRGSLNFNVAAMDEAGHLRVMLDTNPQFNDVQGVLQIQEDGEVFLN